jgi:(S)-mandelate dehydrogenase
MQSAAAYAHSIDDLARLAKKALPRAVFDFYAGGAEDERSLRRNEIAFEEITLGPRVLVDVSAVDTSAMLLGARANLPLMIAPMGAVGFGERNGDVQLARAAKSAGIPYVLSTMATASMERIATEAGGRLWFQIYPLKNEAFRSQLVRRAHEAGYEALLVTVDVPVGGKRERDLRNDFAMPFKYTMRNVLDFASHPFWAMDMLMRGVPKMENLAGLAPVPDDNARQVASVGREFDPSFDWEGLKKLRDSWQGKLIVKGILAVDDAVRVAEMGCDGLVVSNHGGRQLDNGMASLDALPSIAAAVGHQVEVLFDGGVRRGSDIAKALALGAAGVLIGRAALYGVCAGAEAGAARAIEILRDELIRTSQLCGITNISNFNQHTLDNRGRTAASEVLRGRY